MASFGEELKRERELRDISLKEISEATKISIRFLEALEQNNFDVLPGGVFNRGFIRAYARFIGVDGEEMVNAYLHEVAQRESRQAQSGKNMPRTATGAASPAEPGLAGRVESRAPKRIESRSAARGESHTDIPPETKFSARSRQDTNEGRASMAFWALVAIALLIGVVVIAMSFINSRQLNASADGHAQALRARLSKKPEGPAPTGPGSEPVAQTSAGAAQPQDGMQPPTGASEPASTPGSAPDSPQNKMDAGQSPKEQSASAPGSDLGGLGQAPQVPEHRLRLRVLEATRVLVECAGKLALDQELWPGQSRSLNCQEPVVLSAGNGGAVEYTLDDGAPSLLGVVGQQIEGLTVAPVAPPASDGQESKDAHAGR